MAKNELESLEKYDLGNKTNKKCKLYVINLYDSEVDLMKEVKKLSTLIPGSIPSYVNQNSKKESEILD